MKLQNSSALPFKEYLNQITSDLFVRKSKTRIKKELIGRECILVVDDEIIILKLLYSILSPQYDLVVKNSPIQALKWLHEGNLPAVIICEFQLPHFKSASFIQTVKNSGMSNRIPVILLSKADQFEERISKMPFTIDAMLRKPFDPAQLKKIIQKVLHGNEPRLSY